MMELLSKSQGVDGGMDNISIPHDMDYKGVIMAQAPVPDSLMAKVANLRPGAHSISVIMLIG
jgi:hypothetical protein